LKSIADDSKKYVPHLEKWGREMDGEAAKACKDLETILRQVIDEIDELSVRSTAEKVWSAVQLRFHAPKFQTKLAKAIQEFQLRMCVEGNKTVEKS
jgi:predicted transcriptional regulator